MLKSEQKEMEKELDILHKKIKTIQTESKRLEKEDKKAWLAYYKKNEAKLNKYIEEYNQLLGIYEIAL